MTTANTSSDICSTPPSLGARLNAIADLVASAPEPYSHIWDCCCDHGYLGIHLIRQQLCGKVIFVDQVPHLIEELKPRLCEFASEHYDAIAGDAGQLRIDSQHRNLVIIAGVGGECMVDILSRLEVNNSLAQLDFIFCPTTSQYDLREYLANREFGLLYESLVTEKGRDYELIYAQGSCRSSSQPQVSLTGQLWDRKNALHSRHLKKLITHYQRCTRGEKAPRAQVILDEYLACWKRMSDISST
ncbi:hypothetical protein HBA55_00740 [Pseudomaricurvus alkylphenolicus]|uniref:tRNA (adenine(22)-N(1))-methyltransferase n=1 Tax=Pseudomaricurvus alkylphenolicus TaxID=1306991 RepID=UPI00141E407C|nr:tRNA (adenine(22)-N(1))-methyltransferase TrmK [Pseudomaricurvus alkylphenolicus]NIB38087.1 hypothetical protein [Pseudomaricurvus alkylphenolicus]